MICVPQLPAPLWKWNNLFSKRCAWKDPSGMGEVRHTHVTTLRVRVRLWKNTSDATPLARFWSRLLFLLFFFNPCFFFIIFKIFTFGPHYAACRILVPWAGIWPTPPALESWSLNHWTAWEGPSYSWITPLLAFPSTRPCEIIPISLTGCCKSSFLASYHFCGYPLSPLPALHCLRGQLLLWGTRPGRGVWKDEICGSLITEVDGWFL